MSNRLAILIVKEVKELVRDPKILIGVILMPLIIFPVMGSAIGISQASVRKAISQASFAVYTEDRGATSMTLLRFLSEDNTVIQIEAPSLPGALLAFQGTNASAMLYIPYGHSKNASMGLKGHMKIYANLKSLTIAETNGVDVINSLIGF